MVDDEVLESGKTMVHWVPSLDEGQGCLVDLWVGEILRGYVNLQPQQPHSCRGGARGCCVGTFLSALMLGKGGRLLAAAEADLPPL